MVYRTFKYKPAYLRELAGYYQNGEREIGESETNIFKLTRTIYLTSKMTLSSSGNL